MKVALFRFNGGLFIDLRHHVKNEELSEKYQADTFLASKKGVCLSVEQFDVLTQCLPKIQNAVAVERQKLAAEK